MYLIIKLISTNWIIISIDHKNVFFQEYAFNVKCLETLRDTKLVKIMKAIFDKIIENIILNGSILKAFPLKSGIRQRCQLYPVLFNIVHEVLFTHFFIRFTCQPHSLPLLISLPHHEPYTLLKGYKTSQVKSIKSGISAWGWTKPLTIASRLAKYPNRDNGLLS